MCLLYVDFAVNNLFQQQYSKVIKPTKRFLPKMPYLQHSIRSYHNSETAFNIRLNNHRKDVKIPNARPACKHFKKHHHDFNNHKKRIIVEQLRNINKTSTEILKERPKQRENLWTMKLEILTLHGVNQDLN